MNSNKIELTPEQEQYALRITYTLLSDLYLKKFFKDVMVLVLLLKCLFGFEITPDMIEYEDTENSSDGDMVMRHDLFVTIHFKDEDKIIHIGLEMQNRYDNFLNLRMENDVHLGKGIKLSSKDQSKKISYYGIWFLSPECSKHYEFHNFIEDYTYRKKNGTILAGVDYIYLINLQMMSECSTIKLRELAKLFLKYDYKKSDFKSYAGKVWYSKMEMLNQTDALKRSAYKRIMHEQEVQDQIDYAITEGINKGINEAKITAKAEGKADIVKNMLLKGYDVAFISECTGLSILEIENLNNN